MVGQAGMPINNTLNDTIKDTYKRF